MRFTPTIGAAAGLAALLVAAPLPAAAQPVADATTGDLTVTRFDDRYADGLFDPSKTAPNGDVDSLNTSFAAQLIDVEGTRHYRSADDDGLYRFADIPAGPATLYLGYPNGPAGEVLFDATGAVSAADITRLASAEYFGQQGVLELVIDEDGEERLIGMSALRSVANVVDAEGAPVSGVAVELGSGDDWYPATEYSFQPGTYEAFQAGGYIRHLPGELSVRLTPPAGTRIASVTAGDVNAFTVTERDGVYSYSSSEVLNFFWNPAFTITLEAAPDVARPEATLVTPTTKGPFSTLSLQVDATDDTALRRIVANIYQGSTLVKSTQTAVSGASGTHTATVSLPDGQYLIRYNAQDAAGNVSQTRTVPVRIDATAPTVTIKPEARFTQATGSTYDFVSVKLFDAGSIDRVVLNGVEKDLTDNTWSDVNVIEPGVFGAVAGVNALVAYDVAGNATTVEFTLN